ncbi:hypothetical protein KSF_021690 [Reticulibacter mediterranei]|uniref:Ubiquitin-like domain-containing protein n=1 Tax=Reticulibacter mediterranei TaxID=2778369 RepID=A0A8J3IME9_9CHLR|nr:EsaB/YukD family protein [Reticulibacter mediterranei]GHO92121.1 hypothetical protein KSF_021690 [Reticulibacter mediterranei]
MTEIKVIFVNADDNSELDVEIDNTMTTEQVIKALIEENFISPSTDPTRSYMLTIYGRNTIAESQTFAQAGVVTGDRIRVSITQRGGGPGWIEILAVAASVGSIAQVALMIADMWSRRQKKQLSTKTSQNVSKQNASKDWDHITKIYAEMTDGTRISFASWHDNPEKIKSFVQTFNLPSTSSKPVRIVFVLKDNTAIRVDASESAANKQQLEQLINYLNL